MKRLTKIPRLFLNTEQILRTAETTKAFITYPSDLKMTGYVSDGDRVAVITGDNGYLHIDKEEGAVILKELAYIFEDMDRRDRD